LNSRETDMDSSFTIKPLAAATKSYSRDHVTARGTVETDLDATRSVAATGDGGGEQPDRRHDHPPPDLVADPESREVINRENDVSTQAIEREHPDQALLRQRAYRQPRGEAEHPPDTEPHANIKA
jgi:hypothetical protein